MSEQTTPPESAGSGPGPENEPTAPDAPKPDPAPRGSADEPAPVLRRDRARVRNRRRGRWKKQGTGTGPAEPASSVAPAPTEPSPMTSPVTRTPPELSSTKRPSRPVPPPETPAFAADATAEPASTTPSEPIARHSSTATGAIRTVVPRSNSAAAPKEPSLETPAAEGAQAGETHARGEKGENVEGERSEGAQKTAPTGPPRADQAPRADRGQSGGTGTERELVSASAPSLPATDTSSALTPRGVEPSLTVPEAHGAGSRLVSVVLGLLLAALVGAGTAAASGVGGVLPVGPQRQIPVPPAAVPLGPAQSVCPAPVRRVTGAGENNEAQFAPEAGDAKTRISALVGPTADGSLPTSRLTPLGAGEPIATVAEGSGPRQGGGYAYLEGKEVDAGSVLHTDAVEQKRTPSSATHLYSASDADMRGVTASSCQGPRNDGWVVGASTEVGRNAVLTLANPTQAPATVALELYGPEGRVTGENPPSVLVPSKSLKSVLLAGYAPHQRSLALRYAATGAPVAASVQQTEQRGLSAGGVEILTPAATPASEQIIPGVAPAAKETVDRIAAQDGYADAKTILEVFAAPGRDALVRVQAWGEAGPAQLPNGGVFTAKGGAVSDFALDTLEAGQYSIVLSAEANITAAVRTTHGSGPGQPVDIAIAGAADPLMGDQLLALPTLGQARVVLGAPQEPAQVTFTPIDKSGQQGQSVTVRVEPGAASTLDPFSLSPGKDTAGLFITSTGGRVFGALTVRADMGAAAMSLPPSSLYAQQQAVSLTY